MATSPIYSWPEPDNTDLVRNGALAIRTLGNAIDTTMATMTPKSIVDAKGDLIAATANDTPARLAVGSNGDTLVADSTASTGLRWSAKPASSNPVLNSGFNVWQRGITFTVQSGIGSTAYTADRYQFYRQGGVVGSTMSRVVTGDTTNLPFIQYAARIQRDVGNTSTANTFVVQSIESVNSIPFAGKTVTFSFYARKGADYSAGSSVLIANLFYGTGTDQNALAGFTGQTNIFSSNVTLTATWQRFTITSASPIASTATQLGFSFQNTPVGTAAAADYYEVTGVQIDIGSVALPFRTAGVSYQQELALCQRYYVRFGYAGSLYSAFPGAGSAYATNGFAFNTVLPVTMRVIPTSIESSTLRATDGVADYALSSVTLSATASSPNVGGFFAGATGLTQYRSYAAALATTSSGYLAFNAEL